MASRLPWCTRWGGRSRRLTSANSASTCTPASACSGGCCCGGGTGGSEGGAAAVTTGLSAALCAALGGDAISISTSIFWRFPGLTRELKKRQGDHELPGKGREPPKPSWPAAAMPARWITTAGTLGLPPRRLALKCRENTKEQRRKHTPFQTSTDFNHVSFGQLSTLGMRNRAQGQVRSLPTKEPNPFSLAAAALSTESHQSISL